MHMSMRGPKNTSLPVLVTTVLLCSLGGLAQAAPLTESFNNPFLAWESNWFALNSNATNYYGVGGDRGNNPDGLWINDAGSMSGTRVIDIAFLPAFAATLSSLDLDIAGYTGIDLLIYDASGNTLLNTPVTLTSGAQFDPGVYEHYGADSGNGIGGFRFTPTAGGQVQGNTGIDNIVVDTGQVSNVPEPGTIGIVGAGLAVALLRLRRK